MSESPATAIRAFDAALSVFTVQLPQDRAAALGVDPGAQEWLDLLRYKLVPYAAGEDCLIVAVCGGTNTGKSTVFNMLLGRDTSPVRATAAATCRPVLAVAPVHNAAALAGVFMPGFHAAPLEQAEAATDYNTPDSRMFVVVADALPERIALLDTPDIDSIARGNWRQADHLRAAGDVLVAVLTGEKYKDKRVVDFFRAAAAAGRVVLPLMNKANPENRFATARAQLQDFVQDAALPESTLCFVAPHDAGLASDFSGKRNQVAHVDTGEPLMAHLEGLDTAVLKKQVYRESIRRFVEESGEYLAALDGLAAELRQVSAEFENRARQYADQYDPAPGAAVGHLFHEFVQSKRGVLGRSVGMASQYTVQGISAVGSAVTRTLLPVYSAKQAHRKTVDAVNAAHRDMLARIVNELAASYTETARNLKPEVGEMALLGIEKLDPAAVTEDIALATLKQDNVSEAYREYANRQLEEWWENHELRRKALVSLDYVLMVSPVAIAGVMTLQTGGLGVSETVLATSPWTAKVAALVAEYQFGDAMIGLLKKWREEQRAVFYEALRERLVMPVLGELEAVAAVLEGDAVATMKREHEACLQALKTY